MASTENGGNGSANGRDDDRIADEGNTVSEVVQMLADGEQLWTMDEMESAEPCDIIEVDEQAIAEMEKQTLDASQGGGVLMEGGQPELEAADDGTDLTATSGGYNYPPPFTRYEVFDSYRVYPYRCVGKLFFKRNGGSYVCSASSIGGDAIWTAGHCLHAGDNKSSSWATNVVFVPAYRDGNAPFGQWHVKQSWVRTAWYKNGIPKGLCQDMGGAIVYKKDGKRLSQVVGWLGFAWNLGKYQHWTQMGYPARPPFNGNRLIACSSSYAYDGNAGCTPNPVGVGSDLTNGSSGGPWVWKFGSGNYVNGLNSYRRSNYPNEMYSPYFNNNAKSLYDLLKSKTS